MPALPASARKRPPVRAAARKPAGLSRDMAPGGIEPPRAASKAAALSAELRGRRAQDRAGYRDVREKQRAKSGYPVGLAVTVAQLVEPPVVVRVVVGSSPIGHLSPRALARTASRKDATSGCAPAGGVTA